MPTFKLEPLAYQPPGKIPSSLHCLKTYNGSVKVTDWQKHHESQPIDNDPYCEEGRDLHLSHYNRLGTDETDNWVSETQDMLRIGSTISTDLEKTHRPMFNFYTFHRSECVPSSGLCSKICAPDYTTTMQSSYEPPYPYLIQRLTAEQTPKLEFKKMKEHKNCKFLDDTCIPYTRFLQETKHHDQVSYNPFTNTYTDTNVSYETQRNCYDLKTMTYLKQ